MVENKSNDNSGSKIRVESLDFYYVDVQALYGVTIDIPSRQVTALIGPSGCGKSTFLRTLNRMNDVIDGTRAEGKVWINELDIYDYATDIVALRKKVGMVFQEASAALNPVMRVGSQIAEALRIHRGMTRREAKREAVELLGLVALADPERQARAYPHELSGGMKQRVMLAIALSCSPSLLIADEPTTALDVTIQAQILALLRQLKAELGLTVFLITHDLGVVAENADRVGVMYTGRLVEESPVGGLFDDPKHPYTRALLNSVPRLSQKGELQSIEGSVPNLVAPPSGCRFHPRCEHAMTICRQKFPKLVEVGKDHFVACYLWTDKPRGKGQG